MHVVAELPLNFPAAQPVHAEAPADENVPAEHCWQIEAPPAAAKLPAAHDEQEDDPDTENCPGGQFVQTEAAAELYVPAGHERYSEHFDEQEAPVEVDE